MVKILNKNELNSEYENIWLQISGKKSKEICTVGVIYRHPGTDVIGFTDAFNDELSKMNPKHIYYIMDEININVNIMSSTRSNHLF